jgi:signal transduction histidine kinase/CheY-like chemotaxis protein
MERGRVIGTLSFGSRTKERFADDELDLMKTIADHVAIAMQRIRLMKSLERHAKAAEAANVAKSQFLANVSHELRTPMNAILGMTELALDEQLPPQVRDCLQTAKDSADMLMELLGEILDFSRIETGRFRASEKGISLRADVPDHLHDRYLGDPLRLRQILLNLLGNAVKFTDRGEIAVSVAEAPDDEKTSKRNSSNGDSLRLRFSVEDTGIGIAEEDQPKIFAPFTQVDASTTRKFGGTGLGLAICSNLVKMMGGRIWVESRLGEGSTFHFTVEMACRADAANFDIPPDVAKRMRGMPVLIASDDPAASGVLRETFSRFKMDMSFAGDFSEALAEIDRATAEGRKFALAIADHSPTLDGFALAEWVDPSPKLIDATIVLLPPGGLRDHASRRAELGVLCLEKPFEPTSLLKTAAMALGLIGLSRPSTAESDSSEERSIDLRPLKILLAEDNLANQKLVQFILKKHGVEVTGNGREALDWIGREHFDLVLMDVQMPKLDGFQATAAIRALPDPAKARLPVIAMTAHAMKGDRERCLSAGMDGYLAKPIHSREMFSLIAQLLPESASGSSN